MRFFSKLFGKGEKKEAEPVIRERETIFDEFQYCPSCMWSPTPDTIHVKDFKVCAKCGTRLERGVGKLMVKEQAYKEYWPCGFGRSAVEKHFQLEARFVPKLTPAFITVRGKGFECPSCRTNIFTEHDGQKKRVGCGHEYTQTEIFHFMGEEE